MLLSPATSNKSLERRRNHALSSREVVALYIASRLAQFTR